MTKRILLLLFVFISFVFAVKAQVTEVKYKLVYDTASCSYIVYLHIINGSATSTAQRTQFNSSVSIVVPTGSILTMGQHYYPLKNNSTYTGTIPYPWGITNTIIAPSAQPQNDFYYVTTGILPVNYSYNNLSPGDSVKLFGLNIITPTLECGNGVRMFKNYDEPGFPVTFPVWFPGSTEADPPSSAPGFNGGANQNGFTLGNPNQLYIGNVKETPPAKPKVDYKILCTGGLQLDLELIDSSKCQSPYTYKWTGPSYTSINQDVNIPASSNPTDGNYTVIIQDALGCKDTFDFNVAAKPKAGADQSACAGSPYTLVGSPIGGVWTKYIFNPSGGEFTSNVGNTATVNFASSANAKYKYIYTYESCSDTVEITVASQNAGLDPSVPLCYQTATVTLNATSGGGIWKLKSGPGLPLEPTIVSPSTASTNVTNFPIDGTYVFEWTNGSCSDEVTVLVGGVCVCPIVNVINQPSISEKCVSDNGPFIIDGDAATPNGGIYLWTISTNNGATFSNAPGINNNEDYTTATLPVGTFILERRYFITSPIPCGDTSNSVTLMVHPNANAGLDQADNCAILPGGSVTMNASGTGMWTQKSGPSSGNSNIQFNTVAATPIDGFTTAGLYVFEWTDDNGCKDLAQVNITEKPNAGTDKFIPCILLPGGNSTMNATGSGSWTQVGGNPAPVTIASTNSPTTTISNFTKSGIYRFTWGSPTCHDTVEVKVTEKVDAGPDQTLSCINLPGGLITTSANVSGGLWSDITPVPGLFSYIGQNSPNAQILNFTYEGIYNFRYTADGCSDEMSVTINSRKTAGSDVNIDCTILPGGSVPLTALGAGEWKVLPSSAGTALFIDKFVNVTSVYDFTLPGDYFLEWKSGVNCTDTVKINIKAFPDPGPSQDLNCVKLPGGSVTMNAVGVGTWSNGGNPGGSNIVNSGLNITEINTFTGPGTYSFQWTVNGCTRDAKVNVTSKPDAGSDKELTCVTLPGGSVAMNAFGIGIWSKHPANPGTSSINNLNNPSTLITNFQVAGTYKFIWTVGTCSDTVDVKISGLTNAGPDQVLSCVKSSEATTILNGLGTGGTWTALDGGVLGFATSPNTTVSGFLNAGIYNFEWDIAGCKDQVKITITEAANAGNDPSIVTCFVGGQAILNASNPTGSWTSLNVAGSVSISPQTLPSTIVKDFTGPGIYKFLWTSGACKDTVEVNVDDDCPCPIANNVISGDAEFCNKSGLVNITGSASTPSSGTYTWQVKTNAGNFLAAAAPNSSQNYSINNLSVGDYTFRRIFKTNTGFICSDTSNEVLIKVKSKPNAGGDQTISCIDLPGGSIGVIASVGTGNWTALNGGSINPDNANVSTFSNFPTSGTYSFEWTVDGCKDTMKVLVTEATKAGIDGSLSCIKLPGGSYNMDALGTGTWSQVITNPSVTIISLASNPKASISNFQAIGTYKYYWTATNACKDSMTINVTAKPNAGLDINNNCTILPASVSLNAVGTGTWIPLNGGNVLTTTSATSLVDGLSASGKYFFEWTNNTCTDTVAVNISEKANAGVDQSIDCFVGATTGLSGNGNGTWSLLLPNTSTLTGSANTASAAFTSAGVYKYIYALGSCKDTVTVTVGNNCPCPITDKDIIQPSIAEYCVESPIITIVGEAATPSTGTYKWLYNGNPASGTNSSKDYTTVKLAVGTHKFTRIYTTTSQPICADTSNTVTVIVHPKPNAGLDQLAKCVTLPGGSIVTNSLGVGVWSKAQIEPSIIIADVNSNATSITGFPTEGIYKFVWTINNCTDTMNVTVSEGVEAGPNYDTKCIAFPATIQLNALGTGNWLQLINPSSTTYSNINIPNPTVTGINAPGFYTFKWQRNGCDDIVTFNVTRKVETSADKDLGCNVLTGGSTTLNTLVSGSTGIWKLLTPSPGTANIVNSGNLSTIVNQFSDEGIYDFEFTSDGCSDTTSITIAKKPDAGLNPAPVPCFITDVANLNASGSGQWILGNGPGNLKFDDTTNPKTSVYDFTKAGTYTLIWRSLNNCEDTIQLTVGTICPCQIQDNEIIAPSPSVFCTNSGAIQLVGTPSAPLAGTYLWQYSNGTNPFINAVGINNTRDYTTIDLGIGTHRFRRIYTTTTLPICSDTSDFIAIIVESKPNAGSDIANTCVEIASHSISLNGSGSNGLWRQIDGTSTLTLLGDTNPKATITGFGAEGTYVMEWTVNGCSDSMEVYVSQKANAGLDQEALCITLPGGSESITGNGFGTWTYINAGIAPSFNPNNSTTTITNFSKAGTYDFKWTSTNNCRDTVSIKVTEKADAGIDFPLSCIVLASGSANLNAAGAVGSGKWTLNTTTSAGTANIALPSDPKTAISNFGKEGNYFFDWTTNDGCKADVIVVVSEAADAGNASDAIDCYVTGSVILQALNATGTWKLSSSPSSATASIEKPAQATTKVDGFTKEGTYIFTWTATNGCEDIVTVTVGKKCDCPVSNNNIIPPSGLFCKSSGKINLDGSPAAPSGGSYRWLYSLNNASLSSFGPAVDANTNEDYVTRDLGIGDHRFRRVYAINIAPFCSDTSKEILIKVNANPAAGTDKNLSCIALPGGSIPMNAIGSGNWSKIAGANVTIDKNNVATTLIKDFQSEGDYIFQWEVNGCKDTVAINVTEKAKAGIDQNLSCINLPGGQVTMNATGSGTWTALDGARILSVNNATSNIDSFKQEKTYKFSWTNVNGCKDTVAIFVTQKANAGPDQSVQCYLTNSAVVTASTSIGQWSEVAGNPGVSTIESKNSKSTVIKGFGIEGTYRYAWTDDNGCRDTVSLLVGDNCPCTVANNSLIPINTVYCEGQAVIVNIIGSASTPILGTYRWQYSLGGGNFNNAPLSNNGKDYTTENLGVGQHRFRRIYGITTPLCEDTSNIVLIQVNPKANAGDDQIANCVKLPGGSVTMNGVGNNGEWTKLSGGNLSIVDNVNGNTVINNFDAVGDYLVQWKYNGCTDIAKITVIPAANAGQDVTLKCFGKDSTILAASGIGTWTALASNAGTASVINPNSPNAIVKNFEKEGTYKFVWTLTSSACADTVSISVGKVCDCEIKSNLLSPISNQYCEGENVNVIIDGTDATPSVGTYKWLYSKDNDAFVEIPSAVSKSFNIGTVLAVGEHKYRRVYSITLPTPCDDTSNVILIKVNPKPNAGADQIASCVTIPGGIVTMNATGSNGVWTILNGGTASIINSNLGNSIVNNFNTIGDYFMQWKVNGCLDTAKISVTEAASAGQDVSVKCFSTGTITLDAKGTGTWTILSGNAGTSDLVNASSPKAIVNNFEREGTYNYLWTASPSNCTDTVTITVGKICSCTIAANTLDPINDSYCEGEQVLVTIVGSDATPSTGTYRWQQRVNSGQFVDIPSATNKSYSNSISLPLGNHSFRRIYSILTPTPCEDTSNIVLVKVNAKPSAGNDITLSCIDLPGGSTTMKAIGTGKWSPMAGVTIVNDLSGNTIVKDFSIEGKYNFEWIVDGCRDTTAVTVFPSAKAGNNGSIQCFATECATLEAIGLGQWSAIASNPGSANIANNTNANTTICNFSKEGIYQFEWTNIFGCSDTVVVTVGKNCPCDIAANSLSPITQQYCQNSGVVTIQGSDATPATGTYTWLYGKDSAKPSIAPAPNNTKDYTTSNLGVGIHTFVRVFSLTAPVVCADTSNAIIIQVNDKANAGADATVKCYTNGSAVLNASGTGTWTALLNPGSSDIVDKDKSSTFINGFILEGIYKYLWTDKVTGCTDTATVFVGKDCSCAINSNNLLQPSQSIYCDSTNTLTIDGTSADPTGGTYEWQYSKNNFNFTTATDAFTNEDYIINNLTEGNHRFRRIYSIPACKDTSNIVTIDVNNSPDLGSDRSKLCVQLPTVSEVISNSGNTGTWSQLFNNPATVSITNDAVSSTFKDFTKPGDYNFVWLAKGCADTIALKITEAANAGIDKTIPCVTLPGGSIDMTASVGTSLESKQWQFVSGPGVYSIADDKNALTEIKNFEKAGIYTFAWSIGSCKDEVSITVMPKVDAGSDATINCYKSQSANISAVSLGGSWSLLSNSAGTATILNPNNANTTVNKFSKDGTYYVEWKVGTCSDTIKIEALADCANACIIDNNSINTPSSKICENIQNLVIDGDVANPSGGTYLWQYSMNNNAFNSAIPVNNNEDYTTTTLPIGKHRFRRIYMLSASCQDTSGIVTVDIVSKPSAPSIIANQTLCEGEILKLNTKDSIGYTYLWTGPNAFNTSIYNPSINNVKLTDAGDYKLTLKLADCLSDEAVVSIKVNPKPAKPVLDAALSDCESKSVTITGPSIANATYKWTGPAPANKIYTTKDINFNSLSNANAGIYTLVISVNGCTSEPASTELSVNPKPLADISAMNTAYCEGEKVTISAPMVVLQKYNWILPKGSVTNKNVIVIDAVHKEDEGTYKLVVEKQGCVSDTAIITLQVNLKPAPQPISNNGPLCEGEELIVKTAGNAGYTYQWIGPKGSINQNFNEVSIKNVSVQNDNGTYKLIVIDANKCKSDTITNNAEVQAKPIVNAPSSLKCFETDTAKLAVVFGNNSGIWSCNYPEIKISNSNNGAATAFGFVKEGTYDFIYDNGICATTISIEVGKTCPCRLAENVINQPTPSVFCTESDVVLITGNDVNLEEAYFAWQMKVNGQEFTNAEGINYGASYSTEKLRVGTYYFRRLLKNKLVEECLDSSNMITVRVIDKTKLDISLDEFKNPSCIGDSIRLSVKDPIPHAFYQWSVGKNLAIVSKIDTTAAIIEGEAPGKHKVFVRLNAKGCEEIIPAEDDVIINPNPSVNIGNDTVFCSLDGEFMLNVDGFESVEWADGSTDAEYVVKEKGLYSVVVTDTLGCRARDEISIKEFCCKIYAPNIIMVNGDIDNSEFKLTDNGCVLTSKLKIYDRWGNLMYISEDKTKTWDATFNGQPVEQGVYVYIFEYTALDADDQEFSDKLSGDITVIRKK